MTLSVPSFLAAATRASMPPRSWALVAVAAFLVSVLAAFSGGAQAATAKVDAPRTRARVTRRERCGTVGLLVDMSSTAVQAQPGDGRLLGHAQAIPRGVEQPRSPATP